MSGPFFSCSHQRSTDSPSPRIAYDSHQRAISKQESGASDTGWQPGPGCGIPPGCEDVDTFGLAATYGWISAGGTLFASSPPTQCGNFNAASCDECGGYNSVQISLGSVPEEGTVMQVGEMGLAGECAFESLDCEDNGGGGTNALQSGTLTLVTVTDTCVAALLESDCDVHQLLLSRC